MSKSQLAKREASAMYRGYKRVTAIGKRILHKIRAAKEVMEVSIVLYRYKVFHYNLPTGTTTKGCYWALVSMPKAFTGKVV
jgi:hypothetical protein